nr:ARID DNA-binding domain-containing protein [Tanacetum cinerariifolium]
MAAKTDMSNFARERKEDFKPNKTSVMLKYPESIHFSTTCMIKGTDHANWDGRWYISNQTDKHLCYKLDSFCNIKKGFSVNKLENQMKFLFTYEIGDVLIKDDGQGYLVPSVYYAPEEYVAFLNLIKQDEVVNQEWDIFRKKFNKVVKWFYNYYLKRSLPGPIPPTINGMQIHLFDLYKLIKGLGGYLSVYFSQEFDTIGEILGLSKENREEIKRCYINCVDAFTSYFKTTRAPQQGYKDILGESTRKVEDKDKNCLIPHQWDFRRLEMKIQAATQVMISPSSLKDSQDLKAYDLREENIRI